MGAPELPKEIQMARQTSKRVATDASRVCCAARPHVHARREGGRGKHPLPAGRPIDRETHSSALSALAAGEDRHCRGKLLNTRFR